MIIAKDDEAKRSRIWTVVTIVSSILIILIAVFLLTKMFTGNPLEGSWDSEDGNMRLVVKNGSSVTAELKDLTEGASADIKMDYVINKEAKMIAIKLDESEIKKASKRSEGLLTTKELENALDSVATTFDYSVDGNVLTLTEREYGEQMTFTRK